MGYTKQELNEMIEKVNKYLTPDNKLHLEARYGYFAIDTIKHNPIARGRKNDLGRFLHGFLTIQDVINKS